MVVALGGVHPLELHVNVALAGEGVVVVHPSDSVMEMLSSRFAMERTSVILA